MERSKEIVAKLRKYIFLSDEDARMHAGHGIWEISRPNGVNLQVRVGFGVSGFDPGAGLELTLPGAFTLVRANGIKICLTEGLAISELAKNYTTFCNEVVSIVLLTDFQLVTKQHVRAKITLDFAEASHILLMQDLVRHANKEMPHKTQHAAQFDVVRKIDSLGVRYFVLPIDYHEGFLPRPAGLQETRHAIYAEYLKQNYELDEPDKDSVEVSFGSASGSQQTTFKQLAKELSEDASDYV